MIDRFVFDGEKFVFSDLYHNHPWLLKNQVKEVASFVEEAFSKREKFRICHLVAYGNSEAESREEAQKIIDKWEKLFDYKIKSSKFGGNRSSKIFSFISFNVSADGKFHCHVFLLLPTESFLGPSKFVSYFNSNGIPCHPAVNLETGKQCNEVLGKVETFKWLLYLAKWEGQDCFPKNFQTTRSRSGSLKRSFVESKENISEASENTSDVKDGMKCGFNVEDVRESSGKSLLHNAFKFSFVGDSVNLGSVFPDLFENERKLGVADESGPEVEFSDGSEKGAVEAVEADSVGFDGGGRSLLFFGLGFVDSGQSLQSPSPVGRNLVSDEFDLLLLGKHFKKPTQCNCQRNDQRLQKSLRTSCPSSFQGSLP